MTKHFIDDFPDLPDFLRRSLHNPVDVPIEKKTRQRPPTAEEDLERSARRIGDKRWRAWVPGPDTGLTRPRRTTFRKQAREELKRRDKAQAAAREEK